MVDEKFLPFIIRSKLHRPQVHGDHLHRQQLVDHLDQSRNRPLFLISAPAGYGKTTLASHWLEASDRPHAWLSLDETDNDLRLFLSYFLTSIQSIFPDFGRHTLAMVNAPTLPPVAALVGSIVNEIDRLEQSFILALDDFHLIRDDSVFEMFNRLLRHPPKTMHLLLIGRRDPGLPISKLRADRRMVEIRAQDLRFNDLEIKKLLSQMLGIQVDSATAAAVAKKTEGWVTGLVLAAFSMRNQGVIDPELLEPHVTAQSVMEYLFSEVFSRQPSEITQYLMNTAVLDRFCGPLCEAMCEPSEDRSKLNIDGWEFIKWLNQQNLFLIPLDHERRWFRFHHLFQELLLGQLNRRRNQGAINALHTRASEWFAENGLIEEAIMHALVGGKPKTAAQLVEQHGFGLLDDVQWPRLQRWLKMLPGEIVEQNPGLLVLAAWLHQINFQLKEMVSCLNKAEVLCTNRTDLERAIGHVNTLRIFQYTAAGDGDRGLNCARRAFKRLPKNDRWARMFAFMSEAITYQMLGDREKANDTIEASIRESELYSSISKSHFQANPCFVYWMEADLTTMQQTAEQALRVARKDQVSHAIAQALYFSGVVHYHRNELQAAEEKLTAVVNDRYTQYAHNFAHSAFALALVHQARDRTDAANQVGDSVVSFCLDTHNPDLLKLARAFQAELALRQGRTAEAAHWAKQFDAKTLILMYRFYVPHLTQVKVLLAQDSEKSRTRAADLLKVLYDYVIFTHNRRFQMDVLSLQALFDDSRGKKEAALEKLTRALMLAEPGGFIRPFLDLGPSVADLLKKLHRKRIASHYIEKILASFEQEADKKSEPETTDQQIGSSQKPRSSSSTSQPLVEPLTNRELDVLELLAQRLSNQEIAEKLFISTTTVKSHLKNIYQKLDVGKRRQAVEKAKKIGILITGK